MTKLTQEQVQADWIATKNIAEFQQLLNCEMDDGRYTILSQLLSDEFEKFKKPKEQAPTPLRPDPGSAIVDLGNPLAGVVLGALMITATVGGFFLWDNYQGSAGAQTAVLADHK